MKLVLFKRNNSTKGEAGLLTDSGVVPLAGKVPEANDEHALMVAIIDNFETLRSDFEGVLSSGVALPGSSYALMPPLPKPRKLINYIANYWEHAQRDARPINMFLKNPDAVIGPGDTIELPEFEEPWCFMHETELGVVIKGPAKKVTQKN